MAARVEPRGSLSSSPWSAPLAVALVVLSLSALWLLRYGGLWAEGDTARQASSTRALLREATLEPASDAYTQGSGFPAVSAALAELTGVPVDSLQTSVYPLLAAMVPLVAFGLFAEVSRDRRVAGLATLILFLQPDFLFVLFRGSHEKLTWSLLMAAVWVLVRSVRYRDRLPVLAAHILVFYLLAFGLISTNAFHASSMVGALALSLGLGAGLAWLRGRSLSQPLGVGGTTAQRELGGWLSRTMTVSLTSFTLLYLFVFVFYPPSLSLLGTAEGAFRQLVALFLNYDIQANPYQPVTTEWTSSFVWVGLTVFTWVTLLLAAWEWLRRGAGYLRRTTDPSPQEFTLWVLFAGYALQAGASVLVDLAGTLGGNLQLRLVPPVLIFAAPLAAAPLLRLTEEARRRAWPLRLALAGLLMTAFAWAFTTGLLKAQLEPVLSHRWIFARWEEVQAGTWADAHLTNTVIWTDFDERLVTQMELHNGASGAGNTFRGGELSEEMRTLFISDVVRARSARQGLPLPDLTAAFRVYDNGVAQIYHQVPGSPYQR